MRVLLVNGSPVRNGCTATLVNHVKKAVPLEHTVKDICIDDYTIQYCKGCKACYQTARCVQKDGVEDIMGEFAKADLIVLVAPSYWADVPGQLKSLIDRCTPYCDVQASHRSIGGGKQGVALALRTGSSPAECERIIQTITHFYGHLGIETKASFYLCGMESKENVDQKEAEIQAFCQTLFQSLRQGEQGAALEA